MLRPLIQLAAALVLSVSLQAQEKTPRYVSAAGAITETIYALGEEKNLVAADISSVYPEAATELPQIGYARMLSAEGILSMQPSLLLLNDDAGPPTAVRQLEEAGVPMLKLPNDHTPETAISRIEAIGKALGRSAEAQALVNTLRKELESLRLKVEATPERPRVLFVYTRGGALMNVAGTGTGAETIITLAGGRNAITGYEGYRPLTAEGAVTSAPDFILVTTRGLETAGGVDELLKQPGLSLTPAGKNRRVIAMDDLLLLGFGPRLGQAAGALFDELHPKAASGPETTPTAPTAP